MKRDYNTYHFTPVEAICYLLEGITLCVAVNELFYRVMWLYILLLPGPFVWIQYQRHRCMVRDRESLTMQFKDAMHYLTVSIRAGYAVENAFVLTQHSMEQVHGPQAAMTKELAWSNHREGLGVPIEELLSDLADRSGVEDIENFAAVFGVAKRMGGNMVEIIQDTTRMIGDKIDVLREIDTAIASKRLEQGIMSLMPAGIILYMRLTSPGFLDVLYGNALGAVVMTLCLGLYAGAYWLGRRIVSIEV